MSAFPRTAIAVASLLLVASSIHAQSISLGLRGTGSFPTGSFADAQGSSSAAIAGAKSGFGYGLDVGLGVGPIGIYGGFDHIKFDCETSTCQSDGKYTLQGVTVGLKLMVPTHTRVRPFVKGGVTFNDLEGSYGSSTSSSSVFTTDKTPGYELGGGIDVSLLGIVSFSPQVRYIGQNLKYKVPGVSTPTSSTQGVNYFTFDLGLSVHSPFGGM
jgi:opacity protein-like surface antigen